MSIDFDSVFRQIEEVYAKCPEVPCVKCGRCCSSPHLSFAEFAYFLEKTLANVEQEKIIQMVTAPVIPSSLLEGHVDCPALENNLCIVDGGKGISCRYIGIPELSTGYGLDEPLCKNITADDMSEQVTVEKMEEALDTIALLNANIYSYLSEPYFLDALNIQCWFAVCLDKDITQNLFVQLRELLRGRFDLDFLDEHYKNTTQLKEKLDMVDLFFELNEQQKAQEALACMEQIRDGFPNTGAYYVSQSRIYIDFMNSLLNVFNPGTDGQ